MANDTYVLDQLVTGSETIYITDDGTGIDALIVQGTYDDYVSITLEWTTELGQPTSATGMYFDGTGGHRLVINGQIEDVFGSLGDDYIRGNVLANNLAGDLNYVAGGNDSIFGGGGDDNMDGRLGNDSMSGDEGNDTLWGGDGDDTLYGGSGVDVVLSGAGADLLAGGADLRDQVNYFDSDAAVKVDITYGSSTTGIGGHAQGDSITGFSDVHGSGFDDVIRDTVKGTIAFDYNANIFDGDAGNDRLYLGGGNDTGRGGVGHDILRGEAGRDRLFGDDGADLLDGGAGGDFMNGGALADTLKGGGGADVNTGGLGADVFRFAGLGDLTQTGPFETITDFNRAQGDRIDLSGIDAKTGQTGNQGFTFIGTTAFGEVKGQLRAVASGADMLVSGDVNGDGTADFTILVQDRSGLSGGDFLL